MTTTENVRKAVESFFKESVRPVLFAGAGISVRAGLPTWGQYLTALAEQVHPRDPYTRHLMVNCIHLGQYSLAAEYFFLTEGLTDGEKITALTSPLRDYDPAAVSAIGALPFASYATTNYDRVLLDVFAKHNAKASPEVNLGDPTMNAAPYEESFYIARVHGRVEVPASMVLSRSHYEKLYQNTAYVDFLRHLFCTRSLMFLGFSFLDPAIQMVLRAIREQVGAIHSGRHIALVSADSEAEFLAELNRHNIRAVTYSPDNAHAALWDALATFKAKKNADQSATRAPLADAFAYARKYFAAALTRRKMTSHMRPLKQAVAEGMVLEMILAAGTGGISRDQMAQHLSEQLNLTLAASTQLLDSSLQGLAVDSVYQVDDSGTFRAARADSTQSNLRTSVALLADGATNRFVVRENGTDTPLIRDTLARCFEYLVLRRGWDMGAAYAAHRPPQAITVEETIGRLLSDKGVNGDPARKLIRAIEGVLLNPSDAEAGVLAELGRLAFALELVRQSPQDTLFSSQVLPNRIYLDANVLMPAIVEGHPFNSLYSAAMEKLLTASATTSSGLEVCAYFGFLNEVVSHRRLAEDDISRYGARASEYIERDVRLYGSANMNVFVAGFARTLMTGETISFDEYLRRFAPYRTEFELAKWLKARGLHVLEQSHMLDGAAEYPAILHHFESMFADDIASKTRTATLVAHDAIQIAKLRGDVNRGERAVLVTADRRIRDAVAYSDFPHIGSAMLSGVGLVQMIDLLISAIGDERSIANLLWSTRASNPAEKVRRYLVDIALKEYDAALAMNMESIIRELTEDIVFAIERDEAAKDRTDGTELSLSKYVEAFEPKFYELMRAEQERLKSNR